MSRPTLYLMMGYPGAGKTTVAQVIHKATGAVHLWSDIERHKMFGHPTHSEKESLQLYGKLNKRTETLLASGRSVVFDTSFNFHEDREKLRDIAARHGADTLVVWIQLPKEVAKERSVGTGQRRNGYHTRMSEEHFNDIVSKLEPPAGDETVIKIDGTKLDEQTVLGLLKTYHEDNVRLT